MTTSYTGSNSRSSWYLTGHIYPDCYEVSQIHNEKTDFITNQIDRNNNAFERHQKQVE